MNWSWKSFGLNLVAGFSFGIALAYVISHIIDWRRGSDVPDSTLVSISAGGFLAPVLICSLCGWMGRRAKPALAAGFIVASVYGHLGVGLSAVVAGTIGYVAAQKLRAAVVYYGLSDKAGDETPSVEP